MYKSVTLQCSAININKSLSSLTYQWQKNTVDIKGAYSNTYQTNEPGTYRCKVSNKYNTAYTQDTILTLEPIWATDIVIDTTEITNTGKILYTILPENATNKFVTFDTKITPDYSIDSSGNVTINTDDCVVEITARSQFGKDYSEIIGKSVITGYTIIPLQFISITTNAIEDTGQLKTLILPPDASIINTKFEVISGSEYVVMNNTGYVSEVKCPGIATIRVSGFDKSNNVITNENQIIFKNKYIKVTNVKIDTESVYNDNVIHYITTPTTNLSDLKSVKIELYNENNPDYVDVNIDENGKVTGITEDKDDKVFKVKIAVIDKYNTIISNTKEIACNFAAPVTRMWYEPTTFTDSGVLTTFYEPVNATIPSFVFARLSDNIYGNILPRASEINDGVLEICDVSVKQIGNVNCSTSYTTLDTQGNVINRIYTQELKFNKTVIPVTSITVPTQEIIDEGFITYNVLPENATNKNVKFEFTTPPPDVTQESGDANIDNITGKISVINEGVNYIAVVAQDGSGVRGEGAIILKKTTITPTTPTIDITPDNITDSGIIKYTVTPEIECRIAIVSGIDTITISDTGIVDDNGIVWFNTNTINIDSVKQDSNLVVRVSCMDGSGYYVDKTIPVITTNLTIHTPILTSPTDTSTTRITTNKPDVQFVKSWFVSDSSTKHIGTFKPGYRRTLYLVKIEENGTISYIQPSKKNSNTIQEIINYSGEALSFINGYNYCGNIEVTAELVGGDIFQATITAYTLTLTATANYNKADYS